MRRARGGTSRTRYLRSSDLQYEPAGPDGGTATPLIQTASTRTNFGIVPVSTSRLSGSDLRRNYEDHFRLADLLIPARFQSSFSSMRFGSVVLQFLRQDRQAPIEGLNSEGSAFLMCRRVPGAYMCVRESSRAMLSSSTSLGVMIPLL